MRIVRIILIIGMSYRLIGLNQILQTLPGILGTTRQCRCRCCPILSRCCGRIIDNLVQTFKVFMQPSSWSVRDTRPILRQGTSVQVRYLSSNSTKTRTQNSPCNPRKKRCTRRVDPRHSGCLRRCPGEDCHKPPTLRGHSHHRLLRPRHCPGPFRLTKKIIWKIAFVVSSVLV